MAKILIVDDEASLVEMIGVALRAAGHRILAVPTGERAMEAVRKGAVDLMILDVMLPGISGFEVCRQIHADSSLYVLPILMLSAMGDMEEVSHGLEQGADDYVSKPFSMETLVGKVENLLAGAKTPMVDETTSLPGPRFLRLELQKAIHLRHDFSLAYIELLHLGPFSRLSGGETRNKAVRSLAQAVHLCGKELGDAAFRSAHMGGGHFACLVRSDKKEAYCQCLLQAWDKCWSELKPAAPSQPKTGAFPVLELLVCLTSCRGSDHHTVRGCFETLSHLRETAVASKVSGIYCDRRE